MHKNLVLRPSCVPQEMGVNKKNHSSIRNMGFVLTESSQPESLKLKTTGRK
jgi:hypothetical protein